MPARKLPKNPWEAELLRLGRRMLQRGAEATEGVLALGGFGTSAAPVPQPARADVRPERRFRLVDLTAPPLPPDCLANE